MAHLDVADFDKLILDLDELASMPDDTIKSMLNAEADVIIPVQQKLAKSMLRNNGHKDGAVVDMSTGTTANSITKKNPQKYKDGWRLYITFKGTRSRSNKDGSRNAEIAFVNEYGKKGQPARPFILNSINQSADKAVSAAEAVYDKWLHKYNF